MVDFELRKEGELALKPPKIGFGTNGENWQLSTCVYNPDFKEKFRGCSSASIELAHHRHGFELILTYQNEVNQL